MGEESYIYHYVNLPNSHQLHIAQPEENLDMINILTPILNVDDKKGIYNQAIIKTEGYDVIIHQNGKPAELDLEDHQHKSEQEMDPKRIERLHRDIVRKKMARLRETDEQRIERLQKDRNRKKRSRQSETLDQRRKRLEADRLRIQKRRALESSDERQRRLEKNRISKRKARLKENSRLI